MTASTSGRSASACHTGTPSPPMTRTARSASRSSSDPGNVTTPILGRRSSLMWRSTAYLLGPQDLELLDHRVRQEPGGHLLDLRLRGLLALGLDRELDVPADAHAAHVGPPHGRQRSLDRLALGVEQARLELDQDLEPHVHASSRRRRWSAAESVWAS